MAGKDLGIWDDVITHVREELPEVEFRTWFTNVSPVGIQDGAFVIGVPTSFARDWIRNHYSSVLSTALTKVGVAEPRLEFQVVPAKGVEQQDIFSAKPEAAPPASEPRRSKPGLNPKYVFANFIVGENNNFAHAAAVAVVEAPGQAYNPLFLYGDAGLGKTHLMHAVGHAVAERYPEKSIEYVTTEAFTNDLITAIREDRMTQFRDRYRSIDVLLIDDIQFIAGKERTQEEFFHTFNALYESGKQIIMSSDRPPKDIPTLENRLRSRFEWGLITDIQAPELETRIAILAMNAEYRGVKVPPDVIDYIARHVTSNIRELEGALVRAIVYSSMSQQPLNRQTVAKALSDVFAPSDLNLTMADILQRTADHFGVKPDDVRGKGRRQELVVPRQVAMYLIRELTTHSFPEIGAYFSNRDHSTVMYAVNKVQGQLDANTDIARAVRALKETLV
ncbi:MAG: chromosomal replication initiator protein DnaA [Deinococcales bacterium]|nr:chromosomal replication initiator protein DnaA [Deinococcales bacterium]